MAIVAYYGSIFMTLMAIEMLRMAWKEAEPLLKASLRQFS